MMSVELITSKENSLCNLGGQGAFLNLIRHGNSSAGTPDWQMENSPLDHWGACKEIITFSPRESIAHPTESNGTDDPLTSKENSLCNLGGQGAFFTYTMLGHSNAGILDRQMENSPLAHWGAEKKTKYSVTPESIAHPSESNGTDDPLTHAVSLDVRIKATGSIAHIVWLVEGRYYGRITDGKRDWFYRTGTLVWLEMNECEVL